MRTRLYGDLKRGDWVEWDGGHGAVLRRSSNRNEVEVLGPDFQLYSVHYTALKAKGKATIKPQGQVTQNNPVRCGYCGHEFPEGTPFIGATCPDCFPS